MMKHNNSDYKKKFEHQKILQNNEIVATLKEPSAIIEYLENLIFDVIEKRKLKNKRIVLLADNLVTKQLLQSLLVCRKIVDNKKILLTRLINYQLQLSQIILMP